MNQQLEFSSTEDPRTQTDQEVMLPKQLSASEGRSKLTSTVSSKTPRRFCFLKQPELTIGKPGTQCKPVTTLRYCRPDAFCKQTCLTAKSALFLIETSITLDISPVSFVVAHLLFLLALPNDCEAIEQG